MPKKRTAFRNRLEALAARTAGAALAKATPEGAEAFGRTLGRLPGDILYRGKNTTVYFPLATSILVSVVLSVLVYVIARFRR